MTAMPLFAYCRAPLLPFALADQVLTAGPADLPARLESIFRDSPALLAGIATASPTLFAEVRDRPSSEWPRTAQTRIAAYVIRAATRTAPFGVFCGVAPVTFESGPVLRRDSRRDFTSTRPDAGWLAQFIQQYDDLAKYPALRVSLSQLCRFRADRVLICNRGLHEYVVDGFGDSAFAGTYFKPISIALTEPVRFLCDELVEPSRVDRIADELSSTFGASPNECLSLLQKLYDCGFLVSELSLDSLSEPLDRITSVLRRVDPAGASNLEALSKSLHSWDNDNPNHDVDAISVPLGIEKSIASNNVGLAINFHIGTEGYVPAAILHDAERLAKIATRFQQAPTAKKLRERFYQRYESQERLVPLLEVVDPDNGIGSLGMLEPAPRRQANTAMDLARGRIVADAIRSNKREVSLSDDDLEELLEPVALPDENLKSFELGFEVISNSPEALTSGNYLIAHSGLASHGAGRTAARFSHGFTPADYERFASASRQSVAVSDDTVLAELAYMPVDARALNIISRRQILRYVIPLGTCCDFIPGTCIIPPNDIYVGIENDRFFLYSKKLEKRVVIVENHVLNVQRMSDNLARFLTIIGQDGKRHPEIFYWGNVASMPFLPRLRYERLILARARWNFPTAGGASLAADRITQAFEAGQIDERVWLVDSQKNQLLVNLGTAVGKAILIDQLRKHALPKIMFEEVLEPKSGWFRDSKENSYRCEFVASFVDNAPSLLAKAANVKVVDERQRIMPPGSEWLYAKIYLPDRQFDACLLKYIRPFAYELKSQFNVGWFYVRFADPDPHLRLRFRIREHADDARRLILEFLNDLLHAGNITRFAIDTYRRELERYGGSVAMEWAESLFCEDTQLVLDALNPNLNKTNRSVAAIATFEPIRRALLVDSDKQWLTRNGRFNEKLAPDEWAALKTMPPVPPSTAVISSNGRKFVRAEHGKELSRPLDAIEAALFHMHCNRYGVIDERRAKVMQWRWLYSKAKQSEAAGI